ncbi:MAG: 4Fe-4S dicluster domain-containing protein [Chloroflexota bacterium]
MNRNLKKSAEISRRDFLKGAVAGSSLFLLTSLTRPIGVLGEELSGWNDRYGMLTDITKCIGCRRCEAACNKANNLPPPVTPFTDKSVFDHVRRTDENTLTVVNRYTDSRTGGAVYRKIQCNHCAEPACASACLVGALKKSPDGPVIYNESICIGCRYCISACPFYIPAFEYFDARTPAIKKCLMCYDNRIRQGEIPACAAECPVEAITFGKRNELLKVARKRIESNPKRYIGSIYGEYAAGGTDWLYISGVPFEELGFPTNLGSKPYPELTKEFLSAVPLVLVIWPALLSALHVFSNRREQRNEAAETQDS